jgi:hypothetical protein
MAQRMAQNRWAVSLQLWLIVTFQAVLNMSEEKEQCVCIKFCIKLEKKKQCRDFAVFKTAFSDECLSRTCTFEWCRRFKKCQTSVNDNPRSGWLSKTRYDYSVTYVQELISGNRRFTMREIFAEVGISYSMHQAILTEDLNMQCISAKFVRVLTIEQKEHSLCVATNLLQ